MKPIYLEPDEEITSVIDKLSALSDHQVAVVVSKNSTLFQSLINLKLLVKEAKVQGKEVVIISSNKVGQRLAAQVGLRSFNSLGIASTGQVATPAQITVTDDVPSTEVLPDGTKVNLYQPGVTTDKEAELPVEAAAEEPESPVVAEPLNEPNAQKPPIVAEKELEPVAVNTDEPLPAVVEPIPTVPDDPEPTKKPYNKPVKELPAIISRGFTTRREFVIPWRSLVISGLFLLISFVVIYLFLPKATLTVTFPAKALDQTISLSAKTTTDDQATTIAGNLLSTQREGKKTITATGKKDIGTKAAGNITITNKYRDDSGAGRDQTFAAGTKATDSKTKKVFTLDSTVTVGKVTFNPNNGSPIYKSETVKVSASEPGESYNIAASTFSLTGALADTSAESTAAFTGGLTKQVTVLSQEDADKAMAELKTKVQGDATAELQTKAEGQTLLENSPWQTVKTESIDKKVGDQVDSATAAYAIEQSAIVFDAAVVKEKVRSILSRDLTEKEELVFSETEQLVMTFKGLSGDKATLNFDVAAKGYVVAKVNKTEISKRVAHKSFTAAEQILVDRYGATAAEVAISPGWWLKRLPILPQAIKVEYGFNQVTE